MGRAGLGLLACVALAAACEKVPIVNINAGFTIADATWFEEEQTLFFFYTVQAEQGLGEASQLEIAYRTDTRFQDWTDIGPLTKVHTHLPVECGERMRCGSLSLHVPDLPRDVGIRLRYHRDGAVLLNTVTTYNAIAAGPAHSHRSLVVYGVFNEANTRVQWRARHQFPTLRNEQVQELGLRRDFFIEDRVHGELGMPLDGNLYGYGVSGAACPSSMVALPPLQLQTSNRAMFESVELPLSAGESPAVCAVSTVTDATGTFQAVALARKNPQVRPAFPLLRTPIRVNKQVQFLMRICDREISAEHLAMQRQRVLLADDAEEICLNDWQQAQFVDQAAARIRARVDAARSEGQDMVLTLAVHHDVTGRLLGETLEEVLALVLVPEKTRSSPRVSGAFVFDSVTYTPSHPDVSGLALWCPPPQFPPNLDDVPVGARVQCPIQPDIPDLVLGSFRFTSLPILPTRTQYTNFVTNYSEAQGGRMKELTFRAPERTPTSQNVEVPPFGTVTFFNGETLTADPGDAFSYADCRPLPADGGTPTPPPNVFFRADPSIEPLPVSVLPDFHTAFPLATYQIGLFWEFPFLMRLQYETFAAGAGSAYDVTVPFGLAIAGDDYYGLPLWLQGEFPLDQLLRQCTRFCDHPTFHTEQDPALRDSPNEIYRSSVYNVLAPFRESYRSQCYDPNFPDASQKIEEVFPRDP